MPVPELRGKRVYPLFSPEADRRTRERLKTGYGKALSRAGATWADVAARADLFLDFAHPSGSISSGASGADTLFSGRTFTPEGLILLTGELRLLAGREEREKLAYAYLSEGTKYPERFTHALRTYARNARDRIVPRILNADDGAAMERYLSLYARVELPTVLELLGEARRRRLTEVTACLLRYRKERFTPEEEAAYEDAETDKALGFREMNARDWRRILRFSIRHGQVCVTGVRGEEKRIVIPDRIGGCPVTAIGARAFFGSGLEGITLPDTLETIGSEAFAKCGGLKDLAVPDGVRSIGTGAFRGMGCLPVRPGMPPAEAQPLPADMKAGVFVEFGRYPADALLTLAPIRWRVIGTKGSAALLLAEDAIDFLPYHDRPGYVTWETCSLRAYLNGAFLSDAFTPEERRRIRKSVQRNPDNHVYRTRGGRETEDAVFLPDDAQTQELEEGPVSPACAPTPFARLLRAPAGTGAGNCGWWLRCPGISGDFAAYVFSDGKVFYSGCGARNECTAVRPALWIELKG